MSPADGAYSVASTAAIAFLQASRRSFILSDSFGSGEFLSVPRRGNSIGKQPRALSQPRSMQRTSSRICPALSEMLGIYALLIFSSPSIASMSASSSRLQ